MENELALLMVRTSQVTSANPMVSMLWTCPLKEHLTPAPSLFVKTTVVYFHRNPTLRMKRSVNHAPSALP